MSQLLKKGFAALAAIFCGATLFAQVTTSSLGGMVADEFGEALPGAAVIATHTPSGTQYSAIANNDGRFAIGGMRTGGPYTIEFSFIGTNTVRYENIYLKLGEMYELNAKLVSANELDAVTIVAEKGFNASITGAGQSFGQRAVETMPTIDRSVYDVVKYTPQATINKTGGISFAGANNRYNSFQIDGAVANDTFGLASSGTNGGQTGANPIALDAIEEIQVVVAPFDVRQSGFTGGAINANTKSGTNTIKGTAYTYYNNQDFIGTTAGKMAEGQKRTKYDTQMSNTIGFTIGGPIVKNKLFLFVAGEYYKKSRPNIYTPANGSYEGREDVKLASPVIIGDKTYETFNAELAQKVIEHYEATYGVGNTGESFTQHQVEDKFYNILARMDWNINNNNKLMFRYQYMDASADIYSSGRYTYYFNNSGHKKVNKTNTFVAELNSRIDEKFQNTFRASAVLVRDHREVPYNGANMYIKDNVTIDLGTEYSSGANSMASDTYTITDNLSWYLGKHELTFGTHNEFYKFNNLFLQYAFGGYTYSSLADFFSNKIYEFNYRYSDPELTGGDTRWKATTHAAQFGFYVQDEWKPNTNLTLTLGMRVDVPLLMNDPTPNPAFNNKYLTDGTKDENGEYVPYKGVKRLSVSRQTGEMVGAVPNVVPLWSPRFGFRWFTNDSHKTLFRGGVGLFTGRVPFVWLSNAYNNTGMEAKSVKVSQKAIEGMDSFPMTSNPYKDIVLTGIAAAGGKATINTINKKFKYPQVFRANLGFEQIFGDGWKFTFDGLYSKTLNNVFFANLAIEKQGVVYGVNKEVANENNVAPYYNSDSVDTPYSAVIALRNTNKGYTYSFSGKIERHFDFGLDLMAAYTFGHSYSVNDGTSSVALSNWQYNYSKDTNAPELSYSLFDKPHKVIAVASYKTPVYLGGMQSTITLSYEGGSGQRYSYTMNEGSGDFNNDGRQGNSVMYIPTKDEIGQMNWSKPGDAAAFERFIRNDSYLSKHRGQWSKRYAGIAPFEHHFDVQFAQDFIYDKENGRKFTLTVDLLNASNLLNRNWGLYNSGAYNLQILEIKGMDVDKETGNATPTYHFNPQSISLGDFYSRWRLQLGLRLTF